MISVGEVQTSNVHTGIKHLDEHLGVPASGSESADNLGLTGFHVHGLEHLSVFDSSGVSGTVLL